MSDETIERLFDLRDPLHLLNRAIAEAAGFKFVFALPGLPNDSGQGDSSDYWHVFQPDGQPIVARSGITLTDLWHGYDLKRTYPDYVRDLGALYTVLPQGYTLTLRPPFPRLHTEGEQPYLASIQELHTNSLWQHGSALSITHSAALSMLEVLKAEAEQDA